jgi:hypothetical protein
MRLSMEPPNAFAGQRGGELNPVFKKIGHIFALKRNCKPRDHSPEKARLYWAGEVSNPEQ